MSNELKPDPMKTGVGEFCQPGDRREPRWIIMYDDADRTHSVFENEEDAREAFANSEGMGWNCWLFGPTPRAGKPAADESAKPVDYDGVVSICDAHGIVLPVDCIEMCVEIIRHAASDAPPIEMSPEFTDSARAALAWVLYHYQGGSSPVGQPIRFALGMGQHEPMRADQIEEAIKFAQASGWRTAREPKPVEHFNEYRRGLREAFNFANIIGANPQGRTHEENVRYMVRSLADLANASEPASTASKEVEPVGIVDENDDGLFLKFVYGPNGNPLKRGDQVYAQPASTAGQEAVTLSDEEIVEAIRVAGAHDRDWKALTFDSGPYEITTPNCFTRSFVDGIVAIAQRDASKAEGQS